MRHRKKTVGSMLAAESSFHAVDGQKNLAINMTFCGGFKDFLNVQPHLGEMNSF